MIDQDAELGRSEPVEVGADLSEQFRAQAEAIAGRAGVAALGEVPVGAVEFTGIPAAEEQPLAQRHGLVADHACVAEESPEIVLAGDERKRRARIGNEDLAAILDGRLHPHVVVDAAIAEFDAATEPVAVEAAISAPHEIRCAGTESQRSEQRRKAG